MTKSSGSTASLYSEVTARIIAQIEEGLLPWVQPWDGARASMGLPRNAGTGRRYSGINVLILWHKLFEHGYASQRWLTYRQARNLGGNVRRGECGTTICYADRFTPKAANDTEPGEQRQIAFLKCFTVFNVDQCEGLPEHIDGPLVDVVRHPMPSADAILSATGADIRVGGEHAFYAPNEDYIRVPPQSAYFEPINWYRTALHELGHWTGHASRLDRLGNSGDLVAYAREELCAEMTSAFLCAELGIVPTVRHADYIGAWLALLREDNRAIFRAASQASRAADYLLTFAPERGGGDAQIR